MSKINQPILQSWARGEQMNRPVLDPCCGSRMCYFGESKSNPSVLYGDIREESHILCDGRKLHIKPDQVMDFRNLPFADATFYLILFDPPHLLNAGRNGWQAKKYGVLESSWKDDLHKGFADCWRVLKPNGTLIFKWNETQIKLSELKPLFPTPPLFGHTTTQNLKTHWFTFFKAEA